MQENVMRTIVAALGIALLTTMLALQATPSSAQFRAGGGQDKDKKDDGEAAARAKERKASEGQYKSAIERLPDQKYDPWRNLR
jgi:hypothetical protein